ncbi:MAG TPA: Na+/H+ antiporter subunit E [Bacteroidales bacterium]|nr:Na+/H+ antiporter subunit E [Bacteroidales bacterium]HQG56802.1 Na+/H+ antiporter subunit E [Bacteroidales bacterium]HRT47572.1 Na+/H+ antiporter subunit E [Bacteroidales bacterium]HRU56799.1 Na+/H+ antiporter subunit E [Bacteroidales bacterium]
MRYVAFFILGLVFWLLLTFKLTVANLIAGAVASLLCTLIFARYYFTGVVKFIQPQRWFWFLVYLVRFIFSCIKANLDVAYRVLHPKMPIRPGIVKVKTSLKSDFAKTLLANSITMTPGTLTVDIIDDCFYIHWIYIRSEDPEVYTKMIMGAFEKYIKKFAE